MRFFNFQQTSTFEEYIKTIEDVIRMTKRKKSKFGFWLYDQNNDDRICPIDLALNRYMLTKKFSYMIWFDLTAISNIVSKQI